MACCCPLEAALASAPDDIVDGMVVGGRWHVFFRTDVPLAVVNVRWRDLWSMVWRSVSSAFWLLSVWVGDKKGLAERLAERWQCGLDDSVAGGS